MGCCSPAAHCNKWWYFVVVSFIIGSVGIITVSIIWQEEKSHIEYSLVFDAGSSHTALYIYTWEGSKVNGTAVVQQKASFKTKANGIHHFSTNPDLAGKSMIPYLDFAHKTVPEGYVAKTGIYLGATAGMRLLRETNQTASDAILTSVRDVFKTSGFLLKKPKRQVRILNGSEEGTFSWITANYLKGNLGLKIDSSLPYMVEKTSTYGALDLGGASTQMTFVPAVDVKMPADFSLTFELYGHPMTVYTHSYLCYGIIEIIRKYKAKLVLDQSKNSSLVLKTIYNPCMLNGSTAEDNKTNLFQHPCAYVLPGIKLADSYTFIGTGDFEMCQNTTEGLFNFTECPYGNNCSFNKVYQPSIKDKDFYAFSTYYYIVNFLNLTLNGDTFSLEEYSNATENWCRLPWSEASTVPGLDIEILKQFCFEAVYMKTILTKGYHFDSSSWKSLHFKKQVAGTDISWTLGFMLYTSNDIPPENSSLDKTTFIFLVILFIIFIFLSVGLAVVARKEPPVQNHDKLTDYGSTNVA